jgi:hypothetical protein
MRDIKESITRRLTVFALIGCTVLGLAAERAGSQSQEGIRVPGNTIFKLELLSSISTANNKKGDRFNCLVVEPIEFKDATVEGQITKLKNAGRAGKKSEIALAFKSITMKDGRTGKFDGQIKDVYEVAGASTQGRADEEGRVQGKSVQKRALKIAVGVAVGAAIGAILGGGKGAVIGGALGGSLGAATTISEKSPNMEFTQGTLLDVKTAGR